MSTNQNYVDGAFIIPCNTISSGVFSKKFVRPRNIDPRPMKLDINLPISSSSVDLAICRLSMLNCNQAFLFFFFCFELVIDSLYFEDCIKILSVQSGTKTVHGLPFWKAIG